MAPHGQESVTTASIVYELRKWLVLPYPFLRRFSLTHAARIREWLEGLVEQWNSKTVEVEQQNSRMVEQWNSRTVEAWNNGTVKQ